MKITTTIVHVFGAGVVLSFRGIEAMIVLTFSLLVFSCIDVLTGYYKNPPKSRTSNKLSRGIMVRMIKFTFVMTLLVVTGHASHTFPDWGPAIGSVPLLIVFAWNMSEIKSIAENLIEMGVDDPILSGIPGAIDTIFMLGRDLLYDTINKMIKRVSETIEKK